MDRGSNDAVDKATVALQDYIKQLRSPEALTAVKAGVAEDIVDGDIGASIAVLAQILSYQSEGAPAVPIWNILFQSVGPENLLELVINHLSHSLVSTCSGANDGELGAINYSVTRQSMDERQAIWRKATEKEKGNDSN
jgi:hypothetical protein